MPGPAASNTVGTDPRHFDADGLTSMIAACRQGDRHAQRWLYDRCREQVYRLAVRIVGVQDAPDVAQNVFLQLFRRIDQFAGNAKFDTWVYRLSVNEALQFVRKRRRWNHGDIVHEPPSRERSGTDRSQAREVLARGLSLLEPELRTIFLLREVEGLSYRDIADAVRIPEGTVGSRLNRARRELQKHLTSLGWEPNDELP